MTASPRGRVEPGLGFWSCPKVTYSKETRDLIKVMMEESRLNNFQQRQLKKQMQEGGTFPVRCDPASSNCPKPPPSPPSPSLVVDPMSRPHMRSEQSCRAGDAYHRDKYHPRPVRDLEKEKHRLQSIMFKGRDHPKPVPVKEKVQEKAEPPPEVDRFEELLTEIEDRKEFLEEMETLGRGKDYRSIIQTEISQKIREMEQIDRKRTAELQQALEQEEKKASERSQVPTQSRCT
ncbi:UPF0193 protein EVG1 isoform X1 [Callorhinchus milii]|nr:UPF0193 protein EVG1 [Callorhinchus milii]XP_042200840.1 UPF0193 protein EVG1 isoform X1 [Callorhinchus milii]XP_042200841.1 UPF0193 protein EVG1 isoform X1 [Callorhinchus milii]XP_042200842.1 UPF0193 protein EVG1 isoform X1 [Callorhinchus milii]XP_042200843.1 UPF0193 protein EVG1 isoform X1 [Callorhinchus milii]AFK11656.1 hypothetical protein [Callorhinchus milii]|eukprot:gi/632987212/ref/XP_007910667.1/ PREDICTED: UPF0193 protein EVG1 [Callorhinchus milii]